MDLQEYDSDRSLALAKGGSFMSVWVPSDKSTTKTIRSISNAPRLTKVQSQFLCTQADVLGRIARAIRAKNGFTLFTLNLDHLSQIIENKFFEDIYARATFITADGWPIVWLARRAQRAAERTTGADLLFPVCELATTLRAPIYLLGTTEAILQTTSRILQAKYPNLDIVGLESPPFDFDPTSEEASRVAERIAASGARLCFVALGAQKQETFAIFHQTTCPETGFLCIGASLDFIAGAQRRAPALFRKCGLEWAWRWAHSPRRLTRRYFKCVVVFASLVANAFRYERLAKRKAMDTFTPFTH